MTAKITWAVVTIACYGLILLGQPRAHDLFGFGGLDAALRYKWYYVLAYAAFGAPLLGALARLLPRLGLPAWRMIMLVLGAVLAFGGILIQERAGMSLPRAEAFMAAVLGLLLPAILVRLLPVPLARRWLGMERRQGNP